MTPSPDTGPEAEERVMDDCSTSLKPSVASGSEDWADWAAVDKMRLLSSSSRRSDLIMAG